MTNPTPHGQVPEALIDLIDTYAETRHRCGGIYNAKTEAARKAVIEALSGVQALSAAPAIGDELRDTLVAVSAAIAEREDRAAQKMICEILAASTTPPAEQQAQPGAVYAELPQPDSWFHFTAQFWENKLRDFADRTHALRMQAAPKAAPGVGNSGFDHQTAADLLSGKTVSDETVRKFVQASRWAHDERAALSATLLAMHGVLTSREAEIALLKKALLEAEAAPQQEAQEPVMIYHGRCTIDCGEHGHHDVEMLRMIPAGSMLYSAPQPAPAPLSEQIDKLERKLAIIAVVGVIDGHDVVRRESVLEIARRAALAAQGGRDAG